MAVILEMKNLSRNFGGVKAVSCLDTGVKEGRITALIGPNGVGKTTAFNLVTGLIPISGGNILFQGKDITGLPPYRIASLGIARTFTAYTLTAMVIGYIVGIITIPKILSQSRALAISAVLGVLFSVAAQPIFGLMK